MVRGGWIPKLLKSIGKIVVNESGSAYNSGCRLLRGEVSGHPIFITEMAQPPL